MKKLLTKNHLKQLRVCTACACKPEYHALLTVVFFCVVFVVSLTFFSLTMGA